MLGRDTSVSVDPRFRTPPRLRPGWRRAALAIVAIVIIGVLALATSSLRHNRETMHPDSVSPFGAGALSAIMADRGISITPMTAVDDALDGQGTILVWDPQLLLNRAEREQLLASSRRIIVVSDGGRDASRWLGTAGVSPVPLSGPIRPSCDVDWLDGIDTIAGVTAGVTADGCFPIGEGHHIVVRGNLVYVASPEIFTNRFLDVADNAAVAIRMLAGSGTVSWLIPEQSLPSAPSPSVVPPALTGALAGFIMTALWYGLLVARPFGPLIPEPLPVVVPAVEATRGRARLYERGSHASHAGRALRAGTVAHHAGRLGLGSDAGAPEVVAAICRACPLPEADVYRLLYGPPPTNDRELVELALGLENLSKELHHD